MNANSIASLQEVVWSDPDRLGDVPCFRGTRVPVDLLLADLKSGLTIDQFLEDCPSVTREKVVSFLKSAAQDALARLRAT